MGVVNPLLRRTGRTYIPAMSDETKEPSEHGVTDPAVGLHPHVPGHDPLGTGQPRERDAVWGGPRDPAPGAPETDASEAVSAADSAGPDDAGADDAGADDGGAPLGGDESTEERLEADTAVEEDALKALDPDDTPA